MIKLKHLIESLEYPLAPKGEWQSYEGMEGWKGKLIWMDPDKFLKLVNPMGQYDWDKKSAQNLEDRMKNGKPLDPCVLEVDVAKRKITGHEGRHRATIAKKLGIRKVPVLVYTGSMFKRVPEWDPTDHDTIDKVDQFKPEWDKTLQEDTGWIRYNRLTYPQKQALYEYMVTSGGVEPDEYNDYVQKFAFKVKVIPAEKIAKVFDADGWDWIRGIDANDEKRIQKIDKEMKRTKQKWPYIVNSTASSFEQWAENELHHGDGFHRMLLSVRKNEPIEFLFLKKVI